MTYDWGSGVASPAFLASQRQKQRGLLAPFLPQALPAWPWVPTLLNFGVSSSPPVPRD